jgi:predicted NAD-dependent protein-ADP-ribosyltransferase YbiA (DUF1768 family)
MSAKRVIEIVNKGTYAPLSNYCMISCVDIGPFPSILHAYYYCMLVKYPQKQAAVLACRHISEVLDIMGPDIYTTCSVVSKFNASYNYHKTYEILWTLLATKIYNNPLCKRLLLMTEFADLRMMNGSDNVLGIGKGRRGLNISGKILMEIRTYFQTMLVAEKSICRAKTLEYVDKTTLAHEQQVIDAGLKYAIDVLASSVKNTTNVDHSGDLLEASEALHTVCEHIVVDLGDFNHDENYEFRMTPLPPDEEFYPINFSDTAVQI